MSSFVEQLTSHAWLIGAVLVALSSLVVIANSSGDNGDGYEARPRRVLAVILGGLATLICLVMQFVEEDMQWLWLAAVVPTYFAVQHGINTAIFKNPRFFDPKQEPDLRHLDEKVRATVRKKVEQERRLYSTPSLLLRFLLPGVMLMLAILVIGDALMSPTALKGFDERFLQGARLGALGAYVYVIVYIGGRTMRSDTTPASLLWSLATLVAGPSFAGTLQLIIAKAPVATDTSWPQNAAWNDLLLPFAAGFSLRIVVNFVNASLRRLLTDRVVNSRGDSLLRIRGITYDIEERLIEEGIEDIATLADANPTRLHRNMRFDRRQIISWIDEALLMKYLPNTWQSLENDGVTGAIDLVWYVDYYGVQAIGEAGANKGQLSDEAQAFKRLAERNKIDVGALAEVVLRMYTDGQVLLIWGLYQLEEGPGDGDAEFYPEVTETRDLPPSEVEPPEAVAIASGDARELDHYRERVYGENHKLFIVHSWRRSSNPNQVADITIKLVEHQRPVPSGIRRVSYFMGRHFGNQVLSTESAKDGFGIRVSAFGEFLCVAKVEFVTEIPPVFLYRYVDFERSLMVQPVANEPQLAASAPTTPVTVAPPAG